MVGAYCTFVNGGIRTEPIFLTRIEDKNGNVLESFNPKTREAINEQTAYKMIYMLRGGTEEEGGTSLGLPRELRIETKLEARQEPPTTHPMGGIWGLHTTLYQAPG
jgi:penicillin-binding protein 1A